MLHIITKSLFKNHSTQEPQWSPDFKQSPTLFHPITTSHNDQFNMSRHIDSIVDLTQEDDDDDDDDIDNGSDYGSDDGSNDGNDEDDDDCIVIDLTQENEDDDDDSSDDNDNKDNDDRIVIDLTQDEGDDENNDNNDDDDVGSDSTRECPICFDIIPDQVIRFLPCMHSFHDACITTWTEINDTCPVCKNDNTATQR
mgnify:FL=1